MVTPSMRLMIYPRGARLRLSPVQRGRRYSGSEDQHRYAEREDHSFAPMAVELICLRRSVNPRGRGNSAQHGSEVLVLETKAFGGMATICSGWTRWTSLRSDGLPGSRYYALVVMDMENWGGRPAAVQARMQVSLRVMVRRALTEAEIPRAHCRYTARGDGMVLALPAHVPKERITTDLVRVLEREVRAYNRPSAPEVNRRLRIALHAGDVHEGDGEWAREAVVTACRLVDADVVRRVLASADTAAVAVVVSASWYTAVISADGPTKPVTNRSGRRSRAMPMRRGSECQDRLIHPASARRIQQVRPCPTSRVSTCPRKRAAA